MSAAPLPDPETLRRIARRRRWGLFLLVAGLLTPAVILVFDLHTRTGWTFWKGVHIALFTVLVGLLSLGSAQALIGFATGLFRRSRIHIKDTLTPEERAQPVDVPIAVIMPICNEEVTRVIEAVGVMYESVLRSGKMPQCDFFILSDSTDPNNWVKEEAAWLALTLRLRAQGRIFYRKRRGGINKKAGNVADFCRRWGSQYRYMIVLDADSVMTGDAMAEMAQVMEKHDDVGILQGTPVLINGESVFARVQQFASRAYGRIAAAGLNFWQLGEGNFWGHNAIIRMDPFIRHCSLPEIPGEGPFSGRIMSHDYVEAALMRRAGWKVWLSTPSEGNFEECPSNIGEFAQRDRRWLQGNLQHLRLIFAKGFHGVNRLHFTLGILSYLASPLWLLFLIVTAVIAAELTVRLGVIQAGPAFGGAINWGFAVTPVDWTYSQQTIILAVYTYSLLFLPKLLALLDLRRDKEAVAGFGGWTDLLAGVVIETLLFTLLAPTLMLFHTVFVALTLARKQISWGTQKRGRAGETSMGAFAATLWPFTLVGFITWVTVDLIDDGLAFWMTPIFAGLLLCIPLAYLTGSIEIGLALKREGLLRTPEERNPPPEVEKLEERLALLQGKRAVPAELETDYGLLQAVVDPYVNAAHVALLRAKEEVPAASQERFAQLREALLKEGPQALDRREKIAVLQDMDTMIALHETLWATPAEQLAPWWQSALEHYNAMAPAPETVFKYRAETAG